MQVVQTGAPEIRDDEIDLRRYLLVLIAWWREIAAVAILAAAVTAAGVLVLRATKSPVYVASATVALVRTQSNITFDERFTTSSDASSDEGLQSESAARREALLGLVSSGAVAQSVIDQLGSVLDQASERQPARLLEAIETELVIPTEGRNQSNLIRITATASSPAKAALIANAWAEHYVSHVNRIFGQIPPEVVASVTQEMELAQAEYEGAQKELEGFVARNGLDGLDRLIAEKRSIVSSLQTGKQTALTAIVDEELQARRQVISTYIAAQGANRLLAFNKEQEAKRALVAALIDMEVTSRLGALETEQEARRQLFQQYAQAETDNRLLALATDQDARRQIFTQAVESLIGNRLVAVQKEQEARAKLFAQYVDTEIDNRLQAFVQEQQAKSEIFKAYASADTRAKLAVFNNQVDTRVEELALNYQSKRRLEQLLADARALREQAEAGGADGTATNSLAILLLKSEVFVSANSQASNLQVDLADVSPFDADPAGQIADLDALIDVIEGRVAELDDAIAQQSQRLFDNAGYALLDASRPEGDPLFAAVRQKYLELFDLGDLAQAADDVQQSALADAILARYEELFAVDELAQAADSVWSESELLDAVTAKYRELFDVGVLTQAAAVDTGDSGLSAAILTRYRELFDVGPLATASTVFSDTSPLFATIRATYPELFAVGDLSELTEDVLAGNPLAQLGGERSKELLQLQGLQDLPAYSASAEPLSQAIDQLEADIQTLQARKEAEDSRLRQLTQRRDLAWNTLTTLRNKAAELRLVSTVSNSEVRVGAPAVEPVYPLAGPGLMPAVALGGMIGLLLAVILAFVADSMGKAPFFARERPPVTAGT